MGHAESSYQQLEAVVGGQTMELYGGARSGVLNPADYPARHTAKSYAPKKHAAYDKYDAYELLLPDGQIRLFLVNGLGAPAKNP